MDTFLAPIENPQSAMMKLVYGMSRRQFGKVMTPLKVFVARMPLAFGMFVGKIAQARQEAEAAAGDGDAGPRARGAPQRLPVLHRYRPRLCRSRHG